MQPKRDFLQCVNVNSISTEAKCKFIVESDLVEHPPGHSWRTAWEGEQKSPLTCMVAIAKPSQVRIPVDTYHWDDQNCFHFLLYFILHTEFFLNTGVCFFDQWHHPCSNTWFLEKKSLLLNRYLIGEDEIANQFDVSYSTLEKPRNLILKPGSWLKH